MMRRVERAFALTDAAGRGISEIRAVLSHRTSEETDEDDLSRATETVLALIPARYTPEAGFSRGMLLMRGGARYRMLVPVDLGRMWRVKCERIHVESAETEVPADADA